MNVHNIRDIDRCFLVDYSTLRVFLAGLCMLCNLVFSFNDYTLAVYDFGNGAVAAADETGGKDKKDDAAPQPETSTSKKEAK